MERNDERRRLAAPVSRSLIHANETRLAAIFSATHLKRSRRCWGLLRLSGSKRQRGHEYRCKQSDEHAQIPSHAPINPRQRPRRQTHLREVLQSGADLRLTFFQASLLHAPDQMIQAVLTEKRLVLEHE